MIYGIYIYVSVRPHRHSVILDALMPSVDRAVCICVYFVLLFLSFFYHSFQFCCIEQCIFLFMIFWYCERVLTACTIIHIHALAYTTKQKNVVWRVKKSRANETHGTFIFQYTHNIMCTLYIECVYFNTILVSILCVV